MEQTILTASEWPDSPRKWSVGAVSGALATAAVAYNAIISLETAITERSPGAIVQAIGDLAMLDAFLGATKESFMISREVRAAEQWHELSSEEKHAA